jgi:hypothetical protein
MTATVMAADAAYPFDYSRLPHGVSVVMGYTGQPGCTPHVWTEAEVAAVQHTGRTWVPIHTPPQTGLTPDMGKQAGNLMVEELKHYKLPEGCPVFLDVERASWSANPAGARAAVADWQAVMHAHGHPQAWAYLPTLAGAQWVADWVGQAPQHFAPGVIGVQYAGNVDGGRYDLSVFAASVFAPPVVPPAPKPAPLTMPDQAWIVAQLNKVQANIGGKLSAYVWDDDPHHPEGVALVHLSAKLDHLLALHETAPIPPSQINELATELAKVLGPVLGTDVVVALGKALVR